MRTARIKSTLIMGALFLLIVAIVGVFTMPKYNGYDLPVLPESEYQNAYIAVSGDTAYLYFVDKQGYIQVDPDVLGNSYTLGLTTTDPYDESKILFAEKYTATIGGDSWTAEELPDLSGVYDIPAYAQFSLPCEIGGPVWSNVTLLDQDGNVFIEGSKPIDADKAASRRYSFTLGYLTALCGPVIALPSKQPTMYSYNGVILPKLPEWDETVFPYALITGLYGGPPECVYVFPEDAHFYDSNGIWYFGTQTSVENNNWYLSEDSTEWLVSGGKKSIAIEAAKGSIFDGVDLKPTWSNFDIIGRDGSVLLPASDPIAVYD